MHSPATSDDPHKVREALPLGSSASMTRWKGRLSWMLLALVIMGASLVRLRLLELPLERDEGEYAYMAQRLLHGAPPYVSAYSMKLPGIYAAYALNMLLFGQSIAGIHLGLVVIQAATILLMFVLGKRLLGDYCGVLSAAAFALLALGKPVLGLTVNAEHFVLLPLVGGLILLLRGLGAQSDRTLLLSGLLFGCALLMKQHGGFFIPFGALFIIWHSTCLVAVSLRHVVKRLLLFTAAAAVPVGLACLIYVALGEFGKMWFWTVVFPRSYVSSKSLVDGWVSWTASWQQLITWAPLLWLLAGVGLVSTSLRPERKSLGPFLLGLLFFSLLSVTPGLHFRGHYFILCLPAAALLAACGLESFTRAVLRLRALRGRHLAVYTAVAVAVFFSSVVPQRALLFQMNPDAVSRQLYFPDRFSFGASEAVAAYLKAHLGQEEKVAVVGSEPQLYFYLDRPAPTRFIYLYYLTERHALTEAMRGEFTSEIETSQPRYLVYSPSCTSELVWEPARVKLYEWYERYVQAHYRIVGVVAMVTPERTEYEWGEKAKYFAQSVRVRMVIYERKPADS
jgi:4-amino-4-deoxy-L-arabinose transferase-like glycosyltransferase